MTELLLGLVGQSAIWFGAIWIGWCLTGRGEDSESSDPIVSLFFGWFTQSILILVLGMAGSIGTVSLTLAALLPVIASIADHRRFLRWLRDAAGAYLDLLRGGGWLAAPLVAISLWAALQFTVPVFFFDTIFYGYGLPLYWLGEGQIHTPMADNFAYLAVPSRMHAMWSLGLGGSVMASLDLLFAFIAATLLVGRFLKDCFGLDRWWANLGMLAMAATPACWELLLLRKDDLHTLWAAAVLLYLLYQVDSRSEEQLRPFLLLSACAGALIALKQPHTLTIAGVSWFLALGRIHRRPSSKWWRVTCSGFVLAVLMGVPWLAYTWVDSGHPLTAAAPYVADRAIFDGGWQDPYTDSASFWSTRQSDLIDDAISAFGRFYDEDRRHFAGGFGVLLLFAFPIAMFFHRRVPTASLAILGILGWYLTLRLPRFAVILVPIAVAILIEVLFRRTRPRVAAALVLAGLGLNLGDYLSNDVTGPAVINHGLLPFEVESDVIYYPASREICELANERLPRTGTRVLFIGESRYFPLERPFEYWNPHFSHPLERVSSREAPETTWARVIEEGGFTHAIYTPKELVRLYSWTPATFSRFDSWLRANFQVLERRGSGQETTFLIDLETLSTS